MGTELGLGSRLNWGGATLTLPLRTPMWTPLWRTCAEQTGGQCVFAVLWRASQVSVPGEVREDCVEVAFSNRRGMQVKRL